MSRAPLIRVAPDADVVNVALTFFEDFLGGGARGDFAAIRPQPLRLADIRVVAETLPREGILQPTSSERQKLHALGEVLTYHQREHLEIRIIDVPQAVTALYQRAVILLSRPALAAVSAAEIQALAAHEMGHDFFASEYELARSSNNLRSMREIELRCDGISVLTLQRLRLDPRVLMPALQKIGEVNDGLGTVYAAAYPTLVDRGRFVDALLALELGSEPLSGSTATHVDDLLAGRFQSGRLPHSLEGES